MTRHINVHCKGPDFHWFERYVEETIIISQPRGKNESQLRYCCDGSLWRVYTQCIWLLEYYLIGDDWITFQVGQQRACAFSLCGYRVVTKPSLHVSTIHLTQSIMFIIKCQIPHQFSSLVRPETSGGRTGLVPPLPV